MYLHLGSDTVVKTKNIIGIFDMDTSTVGKATRTFLTRCEKEKKVVNVTYELPKSFVLCDEDKEKVYITQIASSTILKRSKKREFYIND